MDSKILQECLLYFTIFNMTHNSFSGLYSVIHEINVANICTPFNPIQFYLNSSINFHTNHVKIIYFGSNSYHIKIINNETIKYLN